MSSNEKPTQVVKNDQVEVSLFEHKNCKIYLEVTASPAIVSKAKNLALKEVGKEIEIPGFRKGKAPKELVEKRYPKELETEWHRQIAREAFQAVQQAISIPALGSHSQIRFDLKEHSLEGAKLVFNFETEPKIAPIDYKTFQLQPIEKVTIEEKEVEEFIQQLRFFFAEWKEITDRPIKEKDYLILDLELLDKTPPEKVFADARFEVSNKGMAKWMQKLVLGKKVHDVMEGISEPDEEVSEEEKKNFSPKNVRVTIKKVEEAVLPELTDEFASRLKLNNKEELFTWSKNHLTQLAEKNQKEKEFEQIQNFLLTVSFDLPESLLETETKDRIRKTLQASENKTKWEKASNEEKAAFENSIRKHAENALRLFFLSKEIFHKEKLSLTKEEIYDWVFYKHPEYEGKISKITEQDVHLALSTLYLIKAEDFILSFAKREKT